ncbi:response regulator transcription factor, partial [Streptomyces sp. SID12501]
MESGIRVVIADDHPFTRYGLRVLLESAPDITVVAEACNGREAVQQVLELHPDVVVMDVRMPGGDGLWATQEIQRVRPTTKVLVHSEYETDPTVMAAMRAGASGFLLKAGDIAQITSAVRDVA